MNKVFCRTTDKGIQAFYASVENREYFLFQQPFRISNKSYFGSGVTISQSFDHSRSHSSCVHKTMERIKKSLVYIEREYGIVVMTRRYQKSAFSQE